MNVTILLCHPDPNGFCSSLAKAARDEFTRNGFPCRWLSLYEDGFDPVLQADELRSSFPSDDRILRYQKILETSDSLIVFHPEWWGQMPALLKGWCDRVLRQDVAYEIRGGDGSLSEIHGLLGRLGLHIVVTSDKPTGREMNLESIWRDDIAEFCGITRFSFLRVSPVRGSTNFWRQEQIERVRVLAVTCLREGQSVPRAETTVPKEKRSAAQSPHRDT